MASTSQRLDITIAIPSRNEERNLSVCLQAIGSDFASHVVVIDSASTDATAAVARRHGAEGDRVPLGRPLPQEAQLVPAATHAQHRMGVVPRCR